MISCTYLKIVWLVRFILMNENVFSYPQPTRVLSHFSGRESDSLSANAN